MEPAVNEPESQEKLPSKKEKVLNSVWTLVVGIALFGPFALPLLWRNPRYGYTTKVVVSVLTIGLTLGVMFFTNQIVMLVIGMSPNAGL